VSFWGITPSFLSKIVHTKHTEPKIVFLQTKIMMKNTLQIKQNSVNESFAPINNLFGQFQEFTSEIIFQITSYVSPFFENIIKL